MSLPVRYLTHVLELTRRFGVDDADVLGGLVLDGDERLTTPQVVAVLQRACDLSGEPGLGVYLGLAMRATWHGYLGFAVLVARNLREALTLAVRFIPVVTPALALRVDDDGERTTITLEEREDFGPARDFIIPAFGVGLAAIADSLTGEAIEGSMELALPEPPWFARLAATNPRLGRITFGARAHCLHVATERLHLPCQQADADAQRLAAEQCERELSALQAAAGFAARVRALLFSAQGLRDVEAVARALGMSSRTLKRRLAGEDTSYSALLDQERRARAEALLTHGTLSVKEVAAALGYADTAAFTHAFTRWTGEPPSEFSARARNALTPAR